MTKDIHAKENEIAQVANELARIKVIMSHAYCMLCWQRLKWRLILLLQVDALNTTAHNTQLKATHLEVTERP